MLNRKLFWNKILASRDYISDFLDMMLAEKGAAINTIDSYRRDLEQFSEQVSVRFDAISERDISNFLVWLNMRHYASKTVARKISSLREFYKFLYSEKVITHNPMAFVSLPKTNKSLPKFLTVSDMKKMIATAQEMADFRMQRMAVMMELMYACGLRISELVSLPENCINFGTIY